MKLTLTGLQTVEAEALRQAKQSISHLPGRQQVTDIIFGLVKAKMRTEEVWAMADRILAALSTVPEPGALTDEQWNWIMRQSWGFVRNDPDEMYRAFADFILTRFLSCRPSPAPEPAAPTVEQDYERCKHCNNPISVGLHGDWIHEDSDQTLCEFAEPQSTVEPIDVKSILRQFECDICKGPCHGHRDAPTEAPDAAAMVEEIWRLVQGSPRCVPLHPDYIENVTRAIEFARRGTYTREQVEKALEYVTMDECRSNKNAMRYQAPINDFLDYRRARLTAPPKPETKDAAVEAVKAVRLKRIAQYPCPEGWAISNDDDALRIVSAVRKADQEATDGK